MTTVSVTTEGSTSPGDGVPDQTGPSQRAPAGGDDLAGDIGRRLAAFRSQRAMRVADLAREVGVTPSLISQIERGLSRPSVSTLFAISQTLDVPVDAFFREPPQATAASPHPPGATGRGSAAEAGTGVADPGRARRPPPPGQTAGADGRYVIRRGDRAAIDIEGGVRWERLTRTTLDHLDFLELVYEPGAQSHARQYTHPGTEMVVVMSGCLEITVGFESYRLEAGDSIDFPSSMPHRYVNPSAETTRAVTVILYDCPDGAPPVG
jgi:transcriptional regulator with XRE-family HTH domain/quercetin dioxygenase-like cupin family protein